MALDKLVSWVFLNGILHFYGIWSSVGKEMVTFDQTCLPTDCTQPPFQDGSPFPCAIGMQSACDAAEVKYKNDTTHAAFYSFALLAMVGTYMREYKDLKMHKNPSLNFSLTTPYGGEESLKTKAIQVDFHSPKGFGGDDFYRKNPRCRIFDFSNATRQSYDIQHPREIQFDCFVGLSIANVMTYYYHLKLTSYPSHATTNYLLVVHNEPRDPDKYHIVIAVAAIAIRRSIHVVWERPPTEFKVKSYVITLSKGEKVLQTKSTMYGEEKWEFLKLSPGDFTVKVESKIANDSRAFAATTSRRVRLIYIEDITDSSPPLSLKTVLAAVTGIVIAVILLMVFLILYRKKCPQTCPEPELETVRIIYHQTDHTKVSGLSLVIKKTLRMDVDLCHLTSTGLPKWFEGTSKNLKIVIICSGKASELTKNREKRNYSQEDFCKAMAQIAEHPSLAKKVWFACVDKNNAHEHIDLFQSGQNSRSGRIKTLKGALFNTQRKHKVYCLPGDFTELGKSLTKGNVSEKYQQDNDWKKFCKMLNDVQECVHSLYTLNTNSIFKSSVVSLPVSEYREQVQLHGETVWSNENFQSSSTLSRTDSLEESDLMNRESTTGTGQDYVPHLKNIRSKVSKAPHLYKKLTSPRELDKSCVTLLSRDIPTDEDEDPKSVISQPSGWKDQCKECVSHLLPQSQIYGDIISPNRHFIPGYQDHHCNNSQEHPVVQTIRSSPPRTNYHIPVYDHLRNSEAEVDRCCGPHSMGQQVLVDSGHFEDANGGFRSDVADYLPLTGQGYVFGHRNPKMTDGAPGGARPDLAFRQGRSLRDPLMSLDQNQLYNRQVSINCGSVSEDELYGGGVSTPLLHKDPISHRDSSSPQTSPQSPTHIHTRRDADSDTDRSAVSFCSPDSDNGSFTNSSDGGYCIQQDESGELVLVPKHYLQHMTQREGDFTEVKSSVLDSGLSSRHNSAPEDVAQHPVCANSSTHREEFMPSEQHMPLKQNSSEESYELQRLQSANDEAHQRDSWSSPSKIRKEPDHSHQSPMRTKPDDILDKSCVTLFSHDNTGQTGNTLDSGYMSGSSLTFRSRPFEEKYHHNQKYSSSQPPEHYVADVPEPYVTHGFHPDRMDASLTTSWRDIKPDNHLSDAQLPACKKAPTNQHLHPGKVQCSQMYGKGHLVHGLDRSRSPVI